MFNETNTKGLKKALREMKKCNYSKLRNAVITDILTKGYDDNDTYCYLHDVLYGGGQSGIISSLIYYTDTVAFYKKHKNDIKSMINECMRDFGYNSINEMFINWDNEDIFNDETQNQNIMVWFGYEQTIRNIVNELDVIDLM